MGVLLVDWIGSPRGAGPEVRKHAVFAACYCATALIACSGQAAMLPPMDSGPSDGGLPDAPPDAPPGDAATVTLSAMFNGQPTPGLTVYFQSRDSGNTVTKLTGPDGNASAIVEAGAYVTVVEPEEMFGEVYSRQVTTFADVQPSDHLYVGTEAPERQDGGGAATLIVRVLNEQPGHNYALQATCTSRPKPIARQVPRDARSQAALVDFAVELVGCGEIADLLLVGTDADYVVRSWQYLPDTAIVDGQIVEFGSLQPAVNVSFTFHAVPPGQRVGFQRALETNRGEIFTIGSDAFPDDTGVASITIPMPAPQGVRATTSSSDENSRGFGGRYHVVDWGANDSYVLDFSQSNIGNFGSDASFDVTAHAWEWQEATPRNAPDFLIGSHEGERVVSSVRNHWRWRIAGRYVAGQPKLAYPLLPREPYDFNFSGTDISSSSPNGIVRAVKIQGGYAGAHSYLFTSGDEFLIDERVNGPSGRIVTESASP